MSARVVGPGRKARCDRVRHSRRPGFRVHGIMGAPMSDGAHSLPRPIGYPCVLPDASTHLAENAGQVRRSLSDASKSAKIHRQAAAAGNCQLLGKDHGVQRFSSIDNDLDGVAARIASQLGSRAAEVPEYRLYNGRVPGCIERYFLTEDLYVGLSIVGVTTAGGRLQSAAA